jgi:hypothetical protein
VFRAPARSWISARNELAVIFSTTNPTEVAAALVLVVQSPTSWTVRPERLLVAAAQDGARGRWERIRRGR